MPRTHRLFYGALLITVGLARSRLHKSYQPVVNAGNAPAYRALIARIPSVGACCEVKPMKYLDNSICEAYHHGIV
jgi:hypothetical protein